MYGAITQEGSYIVDTSDKLIKLTDQMPKEERTTFKKLQCGYSHALLIDANDKVSLGVYSLAVCVWSRIVRLARARIRYHKSSIPDSHD